MFLQKFSGSQSCSFRDSLDTSHVPSKFHWISVMFLHRPAGSVMFLERVAGSPSCFSKDSFDLSHVSPKILWTPVILLQKFYGSQRVLFSVGVVMKQGHHMVVYEETLETEWEMAFLKNISMFTAIILYEAEKWIQNVCSSKTNRPLKMMSELLL